MRRGDHVRRCRPTRPPTVGRRVRPARARRPSPPSRSTADRRRGHGGRDRRRAPAHRVAHPGHHRDPVRPRRRRPRRGDDHGSDYPAEAVALPDVADFAAVDVEQIVGLEADLVLAGGLGFTPPDAIAQLRDLGIPVVVIYAPTVEAVFEDIELIGEAIGDGRGRDRRSSRRCATEMDAIAAAVAGAPRSRGRFYEIGYTDATGQIFAPADDSFVAEMVTLAGGDAITTGDPASYEIPLETLIDADPEIIVLGMNPFYAPTPEPVAARPGWDVMTAVNDGAILPVQDTEITRPGPRLPLGLRNLAAAIRPDVALPSAP